MSSADDRHGSSDVQPEVSFVVPVRDDAARLARCLESIRANDPSCASIEIIVADNGSRDNSAEVARTAGARVMELPGRSVAQLRNEAAGSAHGRFLAFVDADHEIGRQWLASGLETLTHSGAAAVGAPYHPPPGATWVQLAYDRLRPHAQGIHEVEWLGSGNLLIRRDAFVAVSGFDTSLETCEDVDLCNRLRSAGYRLVSDGRLVSIHHGDPATLRALFLGELWRGRDNLRVTLRGPLTLRALPSAVIPVVNLLFLFLAVAGLATIPWGGWWLTAMGSAGFLTLALLRAARMSLNAGSWHFGNTLANVAVATVYEAARALALVIRASHRTRRELAAGER